MILEIGYHFGMMDSLGVWSLRELQPRPDMLGPLVIAGMTMFFGCDDVGPLWFHAQLHAMGKTERRSLHRA